MNPHTGKLNELEENNENSLERLKLKIGLLKFIASLFFGTVLTGVLTFIINWREVEIKTKESDLRIRLDERRDLANYFRYTMEGDIYDRLKLSAFFKDVLSEEQGSKLWDEYYKNQNTLLNHYRAKSLEIQKIDNPEISDDEFNNRFEHQTLTALLNPVKVEILQSSTSEKIEDDTLLDIVNQYKIQIFYNASKSEQKDTANEIKDALQNVGVATSVEVLPQQDQASSNQIRYFAETEQEVAEALQNILQLTYSKRSFNLQTVYTSSPGSISIFLKS